MVVHDECNGFEVGMFNLTISQFQSHLLSIDQCNKDCRTPRKIPRVLIEQFHSILMVLTALVVGLVAAGKGFGRKYNKSIRI